MAAILSVLTLIAAAGAFAYAPGLSVALICAAMWFGSRVSVNAEAALMGWLLILAFLGVVLGMFFGLPVSE